MILHRNGFNSETTDSSIPLTTLPEQYTIPTVPTDLTGDNLYFTGDIKQTILDHLEQARQSGKIYWEQDAVEDRELSIGGLRGRVRYAPTFAYRQLIYEQRGINDCSLCRLSEQPNDSILIPSDPESTTDFVNAFNESFEVYPNNFPFLTGQILVASRQTTEKTFNSNQYQKLLSFMGRTGFAGAAMQLEGSGASIPEHAHISVFDESLPIFSSEYVSLQEDDGVTVAVSAEHPSICYRISGESEDAKLARTLAIMIALNEKGHSYNFYLDQDVNAYLIPRTHRYSPSLGEKVGLSLAAGTYNGYLENVTTTDPGELKVTIRKKCQQMSSELLLAALRETTVQSEDPSAMLEVV